MKTLSLEIKNLDFGDARINRRFEKIIKTFTNRPGLSIPQACAGWASTKATYRLLDSEAVKPEKIREAHIEATVERVKDEKVILAIQDTTNVNFSGHPATKGLGILDNKFGRGLLCHSCLAVTTDGVPMGLLYQKVWTRDPNNVGKKYTRHERDINEKESIRWIDTLKKVEEVVPEDMNVILVGDRESDIYDLFATPRRVGIDLLVRAHHDRRINNEGKKLLATMRHILPCGEIKIEVKKKEDKPAREATLEVKYKKIEILPPQNHIDQLLLKSIPVYAVMAEEKNPPKRQKGISWLILTTVEVNSFEDAVKIIEWYTMRWLIERYHYVLKSGCKVEELQLETAKRLERALAVYCIVAWRLLWLTYAARKDPNAPCTVVLEKHEWEALYCFTNKTKKLPKGPLTISEAVRLIAKLGGFLGRKGDKHPGVKTIWCGLRRLDDIAAMYAFMSGERDVGND